MTEALQIKFYIEQIALHSDIEAFEKLFYCYYKRLKNFAYAILKSSQLAEEASSDVFVILWKNRAHLIEIENINSYLYVATRNVALRMLQREKKELFFDIDLVNENLVSSSADTPEKILLNNEIINRLDGAIDTLPPRCKLIYKLAKHDGLKLKEIADILNISVKTVDAQLAIAVKRITQSIRLSFLEQNK
ncbi:RNA polymerase sigma-70 factor [Haoranjiania flava]|uniref:RNA polymerase sigma-70 factor n=1 Tax=Haoranjiania flava TaxID=1856322 RepID=A0AAE3IS05_9BACT|nr:RNA polymerase sigma-70 factor [Haoranjiania flava]MCU7695326.1 RNA polymerase sigma-70 factor [Haoranjiania flava]